MLQFLPNCGVHNGRFALFWASLVVVIREVEYLLCTNVLIPCHTFFLKLVESTPFEEYDAWLLLIPNAELSFESLVFRPKLLISIFKSTYRSTNAILILPNNSSATSYQISSICLHSSNRVGEQNKTSHSPSLCAVVYLVFASKLASVSFSLGVYPD